MAKLVLIGAGSVVFAARLIKDILSYPDLGGSEIALVDIDEDRLDLIAAYAKKLSRDAGAELVIERTSDRRRVLPDADFVIVTIQLGAECRAPDIEIPRRYGVDQAVGDTIGPGGVFRALRTVPTILDICRDMEELCPNALLIDYTNPMAIICSSISRASAVDFVGLCHSVQGTAAQIAGYIGIDIAELDYWTAGINHMAWYLTLERDGRDVYPLLRDASGRKAIYDQDPVRFEILKHFDYFVTESSHHMSEYVPYFRKTGADIDSLGMRRFDAERLERRQAEHYGRIRRELAGEEESDLSRSNEYGIQIVHSVVTGTPRRINANVPNAALITNLPPKSCVEVPCIVDSTGVHPCHVGDLPPQLAALNRTSINIQDMAVEAIFSGRRADVIQAVMLDPLTSSIVDPDTIVDMVNELFEAERDWIPSSFYDEVAVSESR